MTPENYKITVFGAGSFGTAIAHVLAKNGRDVVLWARTPAVADEINKKRTNEKYLKGAKLAAITATSELSFATEKRNVFVFAIPCQHIRGFLTGLAAQLPDGAYCVNLAKGIELNTLKTPSQIFEEALGPAALQRFATVSGPTFSQEICQDMPTGAVVASLADQTAETVQRVLSTPRFRLYRLTDVAGVELGGALKNVMAIGVGIAEGLGFGLNTRAGLITRCLHEMTELGLALGAKARTFSGLSGIGDLILTCTGDLSRNRQVGLRLGRGETLAAVTGSLAHVVEGIPTTKAVYNLSRNLNIDMPNTEQVYKILYEGFAPKQAVNELLSRDLKAEYEKE